MTFFVRSQKIGPLPPTANPYPSRFQQFRRRMSQYGALGFICFVVLFSWIFPEVREDFKERTLDGVVWVIETVHTPFRIIRESYEETKSLAELKKEIQTLRIEQETLKNQLILFRQLQLENQSLKTYLNVPYTPDPPFLTVPILTRPINALNHTLLIGAGSKDGLEKGQAVLSSQGVIGRTLHVGKTSTRVRVITDPESRIPVYLPRTQQRAILAGNGSYNPFLVYLTKVQDLQVGDEVVTSGLGGVFPQGISIGSIKKVKGGFVRVSLRSSPSHFQHLQVLLTPSRDEQEGAEQDAV